MAIAKENPDNNKQIPTVLKCPPKLFSKNFKTTLIFFPINLQFRNDRNSSSSPTKLSNISVIPAILPWKNLNPEHSLYYMHFQNLQFVAWILFHKLFPYIYLNLHQRMDI